MGAVKSIYLTDEATKMLDEIIKKNPHFNFSEFIQSQLINSLKIEDKLDVLQWEYEKKKIQMDALGDELMLLNDKIRAEMEKENKEREERVKIEEQERIKKTEKLKYLTENLLFFFRVTPEQARAFAEDYDNIPKESRETLFEYGRSIGLIPKDEGI